MYRPAYGINNINYIKRQGREETENME